VQWKPLRIRMKDVLVPFDDHLFGSFRQIVASA
jgi:hypothetical protein